MWNNPNHNNEANWALFDPAASDAEITEDAYRGGLKDIYAGLSSGVNPNAQIILSYMDDVEALVDRYGYQSEYRQALSKQGLAVNLRGVNDAGIEHDIYRDEALDVIAELIEQI